MFVGETTPTKGGAGQTLVQALDAPEKSPTRTVYEQVKTPWGSNPWVKYTIKGSDTLKSESFVTRPEDQ